MPNESLMLTGDENIVDINFVLLWQIKDAGQFLFNVRDPEPTVKAVAESVMREIIGKTPIVEATTEGRGAIELAAREQIQQILDDYGAGILVTQVQLQKVDPPSEVIDAFRDVQRAQADRERAQNEAEAFANDILPRARGDAERILQEAQAYRQEVVALADGDAQRFISVYNEYVKAQDVTIRRIYLETMEDVLRDMNKVVIDGRQRRRRSCPICRCRSSSGGRVSAPVPTPGEGEPGRAAMNRNLVIGLGALAAVVLVLAAERPVHRASDPAGAGPAVRQSQTGGHRARPARQAPVRSERRLHRPPGARLRCRGGGGDPRRPEAPGGRRLCPLPHRRPAALLSVGRRRGAPARAHRHDSRRIAAQGAGRGAALHRAVRRSALR